MKLIENLALVAMFVALQAWCAGCMFVALRGAQALGLERDTAAGRGLMLATALTGIGFALWTARLAWRAWRGR